ncbi:hypothetical protein ACO0K7_12735 [Undibacterium sp. Ji67W]|uniref:hypothetical protein n=1 Tax=Undibacterium sp. Ji67W TaxID=3413042 RepID=UPI003BF31A63
MTVVEGDGDDIIEFNLELATGAPVNFYQLIDEVDRVISRRLQQAVVVINGSRKLY